MGAAITARRDIVSRLRAVETDPMWADHGEIPKSWCKEAADEIERLRSALQKIANFGGDDAARNGAQLVLNTAGHLECRIIARNALHPET